MDHVNKMKGVVMGVALFHYSKDEMKSHEDVMLLQVDKGVSVPKMKTFQVVLVAGDKTANLMMKGLPKMVNLDTGGMN